MRVGDDRLVGGELRGPIALLAGPAEVMADLDRRPGDGGILEIARKARPGPRAGDLGDDPAGMR